MRFLRRVRGGKNAGRRARPRTRPQATISDSQLKLFLEVEKTTFDGMKQIALISFAVITGALAALIRMADTEFPGRSIFLMIFGSAVCVSLAAFFICAYYYKKSLHCLFENRSMFISHRKKATSCLQFVIYCSLISFEICLVLFFLIFFKIIILPM